MALEQLKKRSPYCVTTGGELHLLAGAFMPEIRLVTEGGEPAEVYYRIQADGEGVLVVKAADAPQMMDRETNGGCFEAPNAIELTRAEGVGVE
jgi:hypothetical protein